MKQYFKFNEKNSAEVAVYNYVIDNCSDELFEKVKKSGKNIADAIQFVMSEVKNRAVNKCAMVSDEEVFGLIIHYFEEESIKKNNSVVGKAATNKKELKEDTEDGEEEAPKVKAKPKAKQKEKAKPETKKDDNANKAYEQTSLFDFI